MTEEFYNPFHFVPVAKPELELISRDLLSKSPPERSQRQHVTHDRYVSRTTKPAGKQSSKQANQEAVYSGRIICRLRTESPTVLGAHRDDSQMPARVCPYELPAMRNGQLVLEPAIPETSLRGMISALFEGLTNSALRVLNDTAMSVRMKAMASRGEPSEALNAVGMIHMGQDGLRRLLPLTFPLLHGENPQFKIPVEFHKFESVLKVRIYLSGQNDLLSSTADSPLVYFLRQTAEPTIHNHALIFSDDEVSDNRVERGILLARKSHLQPISQQSWMLLPDEEKAQYTPGLLRVLKGESCDELQKSRESPFRRLGDRVLPKDVKHEWFIPLGADVYDPVTNQFVYEQSGRELLDAEAAVIKFESIARTRTHEEPHLPFELRGSMRNSKKKNRKQPETHEIELRHGDLVCFSLANTSDSKNATVSAVSISSVWRKSAGTVHAWFQQIDPNLLPMSPSRNEVTLAEQVFGFVEQDQEACSTSSGVKSSEKRIKNLAGRLKFSSGRLCSDHFNKPYESEAVLQILSSPKPPCPAFYFKRKGNVPGGISKSQLTSTSNSTFLPQGRKAYLIHDKTRLKWRTANVNERLDQKVRVKPLKPGVEFIFDVTFENLSETELGLLLLTLKPNDTFRHRIGMAKPLGLGTVELVPVGVFLIDRLVRYANDNHGSRRYHNAWPATPNSGVLLNLAYAATEVSDRYQMERQSLNAPVKPDQWKTLADQARKVLQVHSPDSLSAVEKLGDPTSTRGIPVQYPQVRNRPGQSPNPEQELFKWHVENEKLGPQLQYLVPLLANEPFPAPLQK